jgi:hypothetical protein
MGTPVPKCEIPRKKGGMDLTVRINCFNAQDETRLIWSHPPMNQSA